MALPPSDFTPSELFRKLQEMPRPSEVVDLPRRDGEGKPIGQLRIQVLSQEQHDEARERALAYLTKKRGISRDDLSTELMRGEQSDAAAKEVLALACLTVEKIPGTERYGRFFPDGPTVGQMMSADEIGVLFAAYEHTQSRFGPYEGNINTVDELNAWVKRLAEGASAYPLVRLGLQELLGLCLSLAQRNYTLCAHLDSQFSTLPDTLKSALESFSLGTGFYTEQPDDSSTPGGESTNDERLIPDEPLSIEQAAAIAKRLHKYGQ